MMKIRRTTQNRFMRGGHPLWDLTPIIVLFYDNDAHKNSSSTINDILPLIQVGEAPS